MKKNLLLIVLLMTLIPLAGYSQNETSTQFTVAGVIVDATGEPLVGTAVYVKNEPGVGVVADLDGKFKIKVTKNATLIFQSVGMKNVEMLITKNEEKLKIVMKEDETKIDEVVVTGMSSQTRYHYFVNLSLVFFHDDLKLFFVFGNQHLDILHTH